MAETEYGGPFIQIAALCERVLHEQDGVISLIRVVDRFTIPEPEKGKPPTAIQPTAVIIFKAGFATGKYHIKLKIHTPAGKVLPDLDFPVLFEGNDRGAGIVAIMNLVLEEEGLHWIDVNLQDAAAPMTRIPLRILHQTVARRPETEQG